MTTTSIRMDKGGGMCGPIQSQMKRTRSQLEPMWVISHVTAAKDATDIHAIWNSVFHYQVSDLIIPTMETARQLFFLRTYLAHEIPTLFVGPTGTGKSVINKSFLVALPKEQYTPNCINFSARTSANQTQDIIMAKLDRRRKGVFGPPMGKKCVVYVGKEG